MPDGAKNGRAFLARVLNPYAGVADKCVAVYSRGGALTQNLKQLFQLGLLVLGFVTLGGWMATQGNIATIWAIRLGAPIGFVGLGWWYFSAARRPENLPDMLLQETGKYFEREGFCFAPKLEVIDGCSWLKVIFQNRYSGHVSAKVVIRPPQRTFWFGRHKLPDIGVNIECPGGAFGVIRVPFPIQARYQGRSINFDLGADREYPQGKGALLRFREGRVVGSIRKMTSGYTAALFVLGPWVALALLALAQKAQAKLRLPEDVAETAPADAEAQIEILWQPDLPTGGFPVLPTKRAA